ARDGDVRAAELHLERESEALSRRARPGSRADWPPLPGRGAGLPPRPAPRLARRAVGADVSASRTGIDLRGRRRPRHGAGGAARAGPAVGRLARAAHAPALLQARGAAAVRRARQAARERPAARRAEP